MVDIFYIICLLIMLVLAVKVYNTIYRHLERKFAKVDCDGYETRFVEVIIWLISSIFPLLCSAILAIPLAVGVWGVLGIILVFLSYGHIVVFVGLWLRMIIKGKDIKTMIRYGIPWFLNGMYMAYIMGCGVKHGGALYQLWRFIFFPLSGTYREEMIDIEPVWQIIYLVISAVMISVCLFNSIKIKNQKQ